MIVYYCVFDIVSCTFWHQPAVYSHSGTAVGDFLVVRQRTEFKVVIDYNAFRIIRQFTAVNALVKLALHDTRPFGVEAALIIRFKGALSDIAHVIKLIVIAVDIELFILI